MHIRESQPAASLQGWVGCGDRRQRRERGGLLRRLEVLGSHGSHLCLGRGQGGGAAGASNITLLVSCLSTTSS